MRLELADFTPDLLDALADAVAERVQPAEDPWLRPEEAASYVGCKRQRIHNLKASGALPPDGFDGIYPLWRRSTLDAYLTRNGGPS